MVTPQAFGGTAVRGVGTTLALPAVPARAGAEVGRDLALDFTKGVLVLFMVLYHWINYFVAREGFFYRYIRFVTPSFIFLTGFLIASVYLVKYASGDLRLNRRLAQRGVKLIALFTVLNLGANLAFARTERGANGIDGFLSSLFSVYVIGDGRTAVFEVLVPIGYMLLLSAALLLARRWQKTAFRCGCAAGFVVALSSSSFGHPIPNLELVTIGLLGVLAGYLSRTTLDRMATYLPAILLLYGIYLTVITWTGPTFVVQIVAVCLTLLTVYVGGTLIAGSAQKASRPVQARVLILGRYSLFSYIAQIVILRLLVPVLTPIPSSMAVLALSAIGAVTFTQLSVELIDLWRLKSKRLDRAYRFVFA